MPPETKPETKTPDTKGNLPEEVTRVLEDIKSKLDRPAETKREEPAPLPDPNARREVLKKSLNFSEEQMQAHEEMITRQQAPVIERLAWESLGKKPDLDKYRSEIEKELSIYPQERRTPELLEKIYYYARGKHADPKPIEKSPDPSRRVSETRVSGGPGYTGADPGMAGGGSGRGSEEGDDLQLNEKEKFVAERLGVNEADYAKSRNVGRSIRELKTSERSPVNSLADVELRRLQGTR